jgi:hypothetical protein
LLTWDSMANALASPHIFEIAFDALTAAVGGLIILLALRVAPALTLSAHRFALQISIVAAVLIIAAQMAEVWADFSRLKHDKGRRRRRRRTDRRMFCRFGLASDGPSGERGNLLLAESGQRGSPDRLAQSILLPPGGGAADRALQEKRSAPRLRRA